MADPQPQNTSKVVIPPGTKEKHGELLELILASESMNDEERQYWINILPIMTPEQIGNLREILKNEREQLKAIDKKYAKEIQEIGQERLIRETQDAHRKRREERLHKEHAVEEEEDKRTEQLLKQIESS